MLSRRNLIKAALATPALWLPSRKLIKPAQAAFISGLSPSVIVFDGDSITAGQTGTPVSALYATTYGPSVIVNNYATGGAQVPTLVTRASTIDANLGRPGVYRYILHVQLGANSFGTGNAVAFTDAFAAYTDARMAAGWKVVVATVLPAHFNLQSAAFNTQFEIDRLAANVIERGWVGVHCNAIADWGGDPTMGAPGAELNATNYTQETNYSLHPTSAGYIILNPISTIAINTL